MLRCPRDISPYCESILNLALEYISYDPNFTDSMEEDTDDEAQDEEDDEYVIDALTVIDKCYLFTWSKYVFDIFSSESANEYTDDEDASWKVRRASAKCLYAIIVSRPEMLSKMYLEVYWHNHVKPTYDYLKNVLFDGMFKFLPCFRQCFCNDFYPFNFECPI